MDEAQHLEAQAMRRCQTHLTTFGHRTQQTKLLTAQPNGALGHVAPLHTDS